MNVISSWLLSITGVVLLGVLSEFVLPEGQINKYVKVIFSFVMLFVIILPLPKLVGKEYDLSKFFNESTLVQDDYLYQLNLDKLTTLNEDISQKIQAKGLNDVDVSLNADIFSNELEIYAVNIDIKRLSFDKKFGSQDKAKAKMTITQILNEYQILKDVEVNFDE